MSEDKRKHTPRDRSGKPIKNYRKRSDFIIPGIPGGVKVPGPTYGDLEKALKIFKRQIKDSEKLDEYKERRYFEGKSAKRVKKMDLAKAVQKKDTKRRNWQDKNYIWTAIIDGKAQ